MITPPPWHEWLEFIKHEIDIDRILQKFLKIIVDYTGAKDGYIIREKNKQLFIQYSIDRMEFNFDQRFLKDLRTSMNGKQAELNSTNLLNNHSTLLTPTIENLIEQCFKDGKIINLNSFDSPDRQPLLCMPIYSQKTFL